MNILHWIIDYTHLLRGSVAMYVHRHPPEHYLAFILPDRTPVILLPGILEKWGFVKKLGDYISKHGHPVHVVPELGYNIINIPTAAKTVRAMVLQVVPKLGHRLPLIHAKALALREVIERLGLQQVVFVAHSKGGLIGKYYMIHMNKDQRVKGMVAVATPFSGSKLAKLIPHGSYKELQQGHKIIQDLEKHQAVNKHIISIYPKFDNHIWVKDGSYLEGAENIEVPINGHHKVLFSKDVQKQVVQAIERIS